MALGSLDPTSDQPRFRQIADQIRAAIRIGAIAPGARLPSEADLMRHYQVARMTVRQAIADLRAEGLVVAQHGRGVFAQPAAPVTVLPPDRYTRTDPSGTPTPTTDAGLDGPVTIDEQDTTQISADPTIRRLLHLRGTGRVLALDWRAVTGTTPIETGTTYVPLPLARAARLVNDPGHPGLVHARLHAAGHPVARVREQVTARQPTRTERRRLALPDGVPVLVTTRVAFDPDGRPVETTTSTRPGPAVLIEYDLPGPAAPDAPAATNG